MHMRRSKMKQPAKKNKSQKIKNRNDFDFMQI